MKAIIEKEQFQKRWQIVERGVNTKSTISALSGVLLSLKNDKASITSTDLKITITYALHGINIIENGESVLPIKVVGELIKKIPGESFQIEVNDSGKGGIKAGKSSIRFSTYPATDYPRIFDKNSMDPLTKLPSDLLLKLISEGIMSGSMHDEFPLYLSSCRFRIKDGIMSISSTDARRFSMSSLEIDESANVEFMIPIKAMNELSRVLLISGDDVEIMHNKAFVYFKQGDAEFSCRKVDGEFPKMESTITDSFSTWTDMSKAQILECLERMQIVSSKSNYTVLMSVKSGESTVVWSQAPEYGDVREDIDSNTGGDAAYIGFDVRPLVDGIKCLKGSADGMIRLNINGDEKPLIMRHYDDNSFVYVLMPMEIAPEVMDVFKNIELGKV